MVIVECNSFCLYKHLQCILKTNDEADQQETSLVKGNWFLADDNIYTEGRQQTDTTEHVSTVRKDADLCVFHVECGPQTFVLNIY